MAEGAEQVQGQRCLFEPFVVVALPFKCKGVIEVGMGSGLLVAPRTVTTASANGRPAQATR